MIEVLVAATHGPMRLRCRDDTTAVLHPVGPVLDGIVGWQHHEQPRRRSLSYVVLGDDVGAQPGLYLSGGACALKLLGLVRPGHPMWAGWLVWVVRCWCELDLAEAAQFVAGTHLWEARVVRGRHGSSMATR